jgi:alkaline phosphatase
VNADHECGGANIIGASRVTHANLATRAASGGGPGQLRANVVGTLDQAGFPHYGAPAADGFPVTTDIDFRMLIGYACNADRYEDWITNPYPIQNSSHGIVTTPPLAGHPQSPLERDTVGNFFITGQIADPIATHTASDIPLSAMGLNASVFTGVLDNTDIFFRVMRVALGDAHLRRQALEQIGVPSATAQRILDAAEASEISTAENP